MGAGVFHVRVRDGIGCIIPAMATGPPDRNIICCSVFGFGCVCVCWVVCGLVLRAAPASCEAGPVRRWGMERYRAIRTAQLSELPHLHLRPINVVVFHGPQRDLVLRLVSRLDAFSGYPFRTWPPSHATGVTTGSPEVRPSRSSRTRDRSSQVSYTHGR